jgi:hypothetical protein
MRTTVRSARSAFRSSEVRAFPAAKLRRRWSALGSIGCLPSTPWRPVDRAGAIAGSRTLLASRAAAISALPRPPDPEVDGARPCRRPTLSPQPDLASGKMHQGRLRDISYATTNRQEAVKTAARQVVAVIVVGAANSSNSQRLREVVEREGCSAPFIPAAEDSTGTRSRAPEALVERILEALGAALRDRARVTDDRKRIDGLPAAARLARGGDGARLIALRPDRHRRERRRAKLLDQKADKVFRII